MYITYSQFKDLGGRADESTFDSLVEEAGLKLDYYTSNRLPKFIEELGGQVPKEIQIVVAKLIDLLNDIVIGSGNAAGLAMYSNGIETMSYKNATQAEKAEVDTIGKWIIQYMSKFPELIYRGVN